MYQRLHPSNHGYPVVMQPQLTQRTAVVQPFHHRDAVREQPQPAERRASAMPGKVPERRAGGRPRYCNTHVSIRVQSESRRLYCNVVPAVPMMPSRGKPTLQNPPSKTIKTSLPVGRRHSPVQTLYLGDLVLMQVELLKTRQAETFHLLQPLRTFVGKHTSHRPNAPNK